MALDTTNILGRGAVRDTYNLLADGIVKLLRALSQVEGISVGKWAKARGYGRYLASSIKGEAAIDWSDKRARTALLAGIVADADRLLELSRQAQGGLAEESVERQQIVAAAELLGQLLLQDVERAEGGVNLKDGVSRDRMMSVHDPEMRHGHKSSSKRFDGHKAGIVVDTDTQLITSVEVLPGNAPDNLGSLELVEASEANTGVPVEEAMGDADGDGNTRQAFADAGRTLIARVPGRPNRTHFPKEDFVIDLAAGSCTCPAGQVTHTTVPAGKRTDGTGSTSRAYQFDGAVCRACPLRSQCIAAKGRKGPGADPSPGGPAAAGPGVATELEWPLRLPEAAGGGGTPVGPAGAVGHPASPLLRAGQDEIPAVSGGHGSQPDPGGRQNWAVRQYRWRRRRPQSSPQCCPRCCRQCCGQFQRRTPRTTMVPDLTSVLLPKSLSPTRAFRPSF